MEAASAFVGQQKGQNWTDGRRSRDRHAAGSSASSHCAPVGAWLAGWESRDNCRLPNGPSRAPRRWPTAQVGVIRLAPGLVARRCLPLPLACPRIPVRCVMIDNQNNDQRGRRCAAFFSGRSRIIDNSHKPARVEWVRRVGGESIWAAGLQFYLLARLKSDCVAVRPGRRAFLVLAAAAAQFASQAPDHFD